MRGIVVFLFVLGSLVRMCMGSWIPGCYSVWDLNELYEAAAEAGTYEDIPSCFCDNATDIYSDGVQVSCLFGSTLEDLGDVLDSVDSAGKQAVNVHMSHLDFGEANEIPSHFFMAHNASPNTLIMTACPGRDNLTIQDGAFNGMENNLTHLVINDCKLSEVPAAVNNMTSLTFLEIRYSLLRVQDSAFSKLENLKELNLSENYLNSLESGSFIGLTSLEHLVLGPKNYFNDSLFPELQRLTRLKTLNLQNTQLESIPDGGLSELSSLQELIFTGNNLVNVTNETFSGLTSLRSLDLRVNLIESVESDTLSHLHNLRNLNAAGNYISVLSPSLFQNNGNLSRLDLGWNELTEIPDNVFQTLSELQSLDLRHNLKLSYLSHNSFQGLGQLLHLNLSKTNLTVLQGSIFSPLEKLEKLELTQSPISTLSSTLFDNNANILELSLNRTQIRTLPEGVFDSLVSLQLIDLSENPWLCDEELASTIDWIFSRVYTAAEKSVPFNLVNSNQTVCDRPYSLRGEVLMDLDPKTLRSYDPESDTTLGTTTEEYTMDYTTPIFGEDYPTPDFDGTDNSVTEKNGEWSVPESEYRPPSSVDNTVKEGRGAAEMAKAGAPTLGIVVGVIIAGLLTVVVIGVIVFAMKKRKQARHPTPPHSGSTEMVQKESRGGGIGEADIIREAPVIASKGGMESQNGDFKNQAYV